jgi:hypothetical protein
MVSHCTRPCQARTRLTKLFAGAPESYRPRSDISDWDLDVKQHVDVWSLGCVYSEANTWVVRGYSRLQEYRQLRINATRDIPGFDGGDCFHDGKGVLEVVPDWHRKLSRYKRASDHVTDTLWTEMLRDMLGVQDIRPNGRMLLQRSNIVLTAARARLAASAGPSAGFSGSLPRALTSAPAIPSQSQTQKPRTPPQVPPGLLWSQNSPPPHQWQSSSSPISEGTIDQRQQNDITPAGSSAIMYSPDSFLTSTNGNPPTTSESIPALTGMPPPLHHDNTSIPYQLSTSVGNHSSRFPGPGYENELHQPDRSSKLAHSNSTKHHNHRSSGGTGEPSPPTVSATHLWQSNQTTTAITTQHEGTHAHEPRVSDTSIQRGQSTSPRLTSSSPTSQTVQSSPHELKPLPRRKEPPTMSVDTLQQWKQEMKDHKRSMLLTNKELLEEVKKRDHVSRSIYAL